MQKLDENLRHSGYDLKMLKRDGMVALFEKSNPRNKFTKTYEVVIIQTEKAKTYPSGKSYPDREVMPGDEDWGTYGWTYADLESAEAAFQSAVACGDASPTR